MSSISVYDISLDRQSGLFSATANISVDAYIDPQSDLYIDEFSWSSILDGDTVNSGTDFGFTTAQVFGQTVTSGLHSLSIGASNGYSGESVSWIGDLNNNVFAEFGQMIFGIEEHAGQINVDLAFGSDFSDVFSLGQNDDYADGGDGDDVIDGGTGADEMIGGAGDDTFAVDNANDRTREAAGGGDDTVVATVSYRLAAGEAVETLRLALSTGNAALDLDGNELANRLIGNAGANTLNGRAGADLMIGNGGNDTYAVDHVGDMVKETNGQGADTVVATVTYGLAAGQSIETLRLAASTGSAALDLFGNEIGNTLIGNAGANTLNGRAGADLMIGNGGNDTYGIDSAGDVVVEAAGGGVDKIVSTVSYRLAAGQSVEILQFALSTGDAALDLTGNEIANTLFGNAGANALVGGGGADRLSGGAGNDTYGVDNAGDVVVEGTGQGDDTVVSTIGYRLAENVSVETLRLAASTGSTALNLDGNTLANTLIGNAGSNILNGRGGTDRLIGGGGDDTYAVDSAGDVVLEAGGQGNDTVVTSASYQLAANQSVETLRLAAATGQASLDLTGNDLANLLIGNAGNNSLIGLGGIDRLIGGSGGDRLIGGTGGDIFTFQSTADSSFASAGIDTIVDFSAGDRIDVSAIDANSGTTASNAFTLDANGSFSAGEIRQVVSGRNLLLEFNTDSDADAEMSILLLDHGTLGSGDFIL